MSVTVAALVVSISALLVSLGALVYTRQAAAAADRQATEARRQADAAHEELRRANKPVLQIARRDDPARGPHILYEVRNEGPQDLDSVIVHRPETPDLVRYPVARLGDEFGDAAELGPLRLGEAAGLLLSVGSTTSPPEFRVRIRCRSGAAHWDQAVLLEPRPAPFRVL